MMLLVLQFVWLNLGLLLVLLPVVGLLDASVKNV
jgi:hypothetical protein